MKQRYRTTRLIGCLIALATAPMGTMQAQTNDEARLTLGIAAGFIGSKLLWDIPEQPVFSALNEPDLFHLRREMRSDITVTGHVTYYSGPHLGITGEFTYLGLGTSDACDIVHDNGSLQLRAVCDALKGTLGTASTTVVNAGVVYRPLARSFLQPYFKGVVGVAFAPTSTVALRSYYGQTGDTVLVLTIYKDDSWKPIRPSWTLGFGVSTAPSSGYQLHVEVRETWLTLGEVTSPTTGQGFLPEHRSVLKGFPSILVGFDIVLAKQRGRRY